MTSVLKTSVLIALLLFTNRCATQRPLVQEPDQPKQVATVAVIEGISSTEEDGYTRIYVRASRPIDLPFYRVLDDPVRIAVDISNVDFGQMKGPLRVNNGTIGEVTHARHNGNGRIEIGLTQMANYNISREDKALVIDIEKAKRSVETKEAIGVKEEQDGAKETLKEQEAGNTVLAEAAKEKDLPVPPVVSPPPANPPAPSQGMKIAREILDFSTEEKKNGWVFNILADGRVENYDSFKLDSPARLVLDIPKVRTRYPKSSIKIKDQSIKEVRLGHYKDKLRLVFDSSNPVLPPYVIDRAGDKLTVSFEGIPFSAQEKPASVQTKASPAAEGKRKVAKSNILTGIDFKQIDHRARIVVSLSEESQFESYTLSDNLIAVDIKNSVVPKQVQRRLETREFESAVSYIDLQNVKTGKRNDARILIKLKEEVPYQTSLEGKNIFIDLENPKKIEAKDEGPGKIELSVPPKKEELAPEPKKEPEEPVGEAKKTAGETVIAEKPMPELPAPPVVKKTEGEKKLAEEGIQVKIYSGRRLSLDFKDADIKNILRLIAEVSNLNIIAGEDVTGKITMRLIDVPWDQAFDVILQARSLGMTRVGNVIRIAPLDKLKREVEEELTSKRAKERLEDLVTELVQINYASAKEIMPQVKSILTDRGDVKVDERTNMLIVKDISKNISNAKNLVRSLDTKTPQVLIEARIVEADLTFQKELGVQWGMEVVTGQSPKNQAIARGAVAGSGTLGPTTTSVDRVVDLPAVPLAGTAGFLEFLFTSNHALRELDVTISAHENKGSVKIISSPKIATLDNKEASIEQGLRIPVPKLTTEGTVSTEYVDANLKLTVTPHVTSDGNIKMIIKAKKDAPIFDPARLVQNIPPIDKKEAITEVLVKDGGVAVIAGIYTIAKNEGAEGIPLFSKIPLLGWLFKRESKSDERTDLLIFISPKVFKDQV